jgi:hypothetical protein
MLLAVVHCLNCQKTEPANIKTPKSDGRVYGRSADASLPYLVAIESFRAYTAVTLSEYFRSQMEMENPASNVVVVVIIIEISRVLKETDNEKDLQS